MHFHNQNISQFSGDLFLKNLRNIPALLIAFEMLEIRYIAQNNHYQIIHKAKIDFRDCLQKILAGIGLVVEKTVVAHPHLDYEKLFLVRKVIASFDLSISDLLKVTKEKLDDMVDFIGWIEKDFSKINISEKDRTKIRQEILIVEYELHHSRS